MTDSIVVPNIRQLVEEILSEGYLMTIATHDTNGIWACDVIYVYDENLNLYWMSAPQTRHSHAISAMPEIAGTITVSHKGQDNKGVQFQGKAEKIEGPRWDLAKKHFSKRGKPEPSEVEDVLDGDFWYVLKPHFFDVIHEAHFGFSKKKLSLD